MGEGDRIYLIDRAGTKWTSLWKLALLRTADSTATVRSPRQRVTFQLNDLAYEDCGLISRNRFEFTVPSEATSNHLRLRFTAFPSRHLVREVRRHPQDPEQ